MTLKVQWRSGSPLDGQLYYSHTEYSFRFIPGSAAQLGERVGEYGATSLTVGTLQIEIGIRDQVALYVWGLHPHTKWQYAELPLPGEPISGTITFPTLTALQNGVSIGLADVGEWLTQFDESTGWVRVMSSTAADDQLILIAGSTVAGVKDTVLHSLWLQPIFSE